MSEPFDDSDLTDHEKRQYDAFVREVAVDGNHRKAALRLGYRSLAHEFVERALATAYVQRQLAAKQVDDSTALSLEAHKAKQVRLLYEIAEAPETKDAARVAALGTLARLLGTDAPLKIENKHEYIDTEQAEALGKMSIDQLEALKALSRGQQGKTTH